MLTTPRICVPVMEWLIATRLRTDPYLPITGNCCAPSDISTCALLHPHDTSHTPCRAVCSAAYRRLSHGLTHLKALQEAGLNHVHLLPSYDYGSVPERPEEQAYVQVTVVERQ